MMMNHCRICGGELFTKPLLRYAKMPSSAQGFPTHQTLKEDMGVDLEVCECAFCGLIQLNNEPVPYYRDVIRASAFSEEMNDFRLNQFRQWVEKYQLFGHRLLELGCGRGEYLSLLQQVGVDAYGLEHARNSVQSCVEQGLSVECGYFGDPDCCAYQYDLFDAFVCFNFMEHWPDPNVVLQSLRSKLTEGAIGLVEVPNFDMMVRQSLCTEFVLDHLLYFTEHSLRYVLHKNGFDVLECYPVWHDYILSAVVKKRVPMDLNSFKQRRLNITRQLDEFIAQFNVGQVAIWGAGHQALTVMALMNSVDRIAYVIDSAPFKQGKYTPATHLPIVPPEVLDDSPVEAVIVMAASYSDEVVGILKEKYGKKAGIAVLRDFGLEILR